MRRPRVRILSAFICFAAVLVSLACWLCLAFRELSVEHEQLNSKYVSLTRSALLHSQQLEEVFKETYRLGALQSELSMPLQEAWARFDRQTLRLDEDTLMSQAELAVVHRRLANVYLLQERWKDASQAFSNSLEVLEELSLESPNSASYRQEISDICTELARTYKAQHRLEKSEEYARRAHSVLTSLPPNFLQEIEVQSRLAAIYQCMFDVSLERSDLPNAAEYLSLVAELLTRISNSRPMDSVAAHAAGQAHSSVVRLLAESGQEMKLKTAIQRASEFLKMSTKRLEADEVLRAMLLRLEEIKSTHGTLEKA